MWEYITWLRAREVILFSLGIILIVHESFFADDHHWVVFVVAFALIGLPIGELVRLKNGGK